MRMKSRAALPLLFLALALSSCDSGNNNSQPTATGNVRIALTDAPSYAFDNVWITVRAVWFHQSDTAPFDPTASGWVRFILPDDNTVTVNLAALTGDSNLKTVFDNLALPVGTYRQMLLFLEPTENALTRSATDNGLLFNNQVDAGPLHAALRVPNAVQGMRIADRVFQVDNGALIRLAIDFDVGRDVLPFDRGIVQEFLLQPRLTSFDLDNAGAIVGFIDNTAAAVSGSLFEVLAEQVDAALGARVVRRAAAVDNATGKFVLYPLVPGTTAGQLYDIVIRGIGWQTAIVKSIPVAGGTTPGLNPTILGTALSPIPMTGGIDFRIRATIAATSGALAKFYQTIGTDAPYVVRQANFDPLSGTIGDFPLAAGLVNVDTFDVATYNGGPITLSAVNPVPAIGNYLLVAESPPLYDPSAPPLGGALVTPSSIFSPVAILKLNPALPAVPTNINVTATVPFAVVPMDNLVFFATFGGTILNALPLGNVPDATVLGPTILNIPGGQFGSPFSLAFYGVSAFGWRTSIDNVLKIGAPAALAKPQTGDASVAFTIQNFPDP